MASTISNSNSSPMDAMADVDFGMGASLDKHVRQLLKAKSIPTCIKNVIEELVSQMSRLYRDNVNLRSELDSLKTSAAQVEGPGQLVLSIDHSDVNSSLPVAASQTHVPVDKSIVSYHEIERRRSIVIGNIPEVASSNFRERLNYDYHSVCNVLDFLGVECNPLTVYRLGRPLRGKNRLIKVVLPSAVFQRMAVRRAPRLRHFVNGRVFLRESLPPEVLRRGGVRGSTGGSNSASAGVVSPSDAPPQATTAARDSWASPSGLPRPR